MQPAKPTPPVGPTEEEKKAERLAKLEAWKQKQAAEKERKQKELDSAGATRSLLDEIDKKAAASPVVVSPPSPAITPDEVTSPVPYAGKFDPKAIAKKATSSSTGVVKLGTDIALPETAKSSATLNSTRAGLKADKSLALASPLSCKRTPPMPRESIANLACSNSNSCNATQSSRQCQRFWTGYQTCY